MIRAYQPTWLASPQWQMGPDLGFHYHGDCERDREASGTTDATTWHAVALPERNATLIDIGVAGYVGDRDTISFRGHDQMHGRGTRPDPTTGKLSSDA